MSDRIELRALTSVRGIAAWVVVAYHIRRSLDVSPGVESVLAKGYLAVDFFFLLSGFVIWMSWAARLREGGLKAVPGFVLRRIARIWPLHLVMLAFAVVLAAVLSTTGRSDPAFPWAELPLHLLLVQNWGFTAALAWNDPAWSISCELAAYLLFPMIALGLDWRRMPSWAVVGAVAALLVLLHFVFVQAGATTLGADIPRLGLIRCLLEFAAGGAVAALWLRWRYRPALPALVAGLSSALLVTSGGAETLIGPAASAAALLALALTSGLRGHPLDSRWLHVLGEASYATYLSHFLLWKAFKLAFVAHAGAVPWPLAAAYLALVLAASFALYRLVELPAQAWLNGVALPSRGRKGSAGLTPPPSPARRSARR